MRLSGFLAVPFVAACTFATAQTISPQTEGRDPQLQHRIPEQHPSDIKVLKQMVVFHVTIHDKSGAPVRGLTAADFNLTDDNVPQTITFVEEHDATQPSQVVALPRLPPGVYSNIPNAPVNDALNVILLDDQDTGIQAQSRLFSDIKLLVAQVPPGARTAIVKMGTHLEIVCGFTADHDKLNACLSNDASWPSVPVPTASLTLQTDAISALSEYLSQFPGRKNILWFSHYFPGFASQRGFAGGTEITDSFEADALTDVVLGTGDLKHPHLSTDDIALYPVDPAGLAAPSAFNASGHGSEGLNHIADTGYALRTTEMDIIAHETGGKAIYGNNDIAGRAAKAIEDGSSYYTIAWSPHNPRMGAFHKVDMTLRHHSDAKLNFRPGYRALPEAAGKAYTQSHPLPAPLAHGSPDASGLLFRARVMPTPVQPDLTDPAARIGQFAADLKHPLRYAIDWAVDPRSLNTQPPPAGQPAPGVTFTVVAYNADGRLLNYVTEIRPTVNAPAIAQGGLQYHQFIDLPEGNLYLRLDVTSTEGYVGATEIALKATPPTPAATTAATATPPAAPNP